MSIKYLYVILMSLLFSSFLIASPNHMNHPGEEKYQTEIKLKNFRKSDMDVNILYAEMETHLQEMHRIAEIMTNVIDTKKRKTLFELHRKKMQKTMLLMHKLMSHDNEMHMR